MRKKDLGENINTVSGLKIYVQPEHPKTEKGKERIWLRVRQDNPKEWRLVNSLCYVNGFDIRFEEIASIKLQSK